MEGREGSSDKLGDSWRNLLFDLAASCARYTENCSLESPLSPRLALNEETLGPALANSSDHVICMEKTNIWHFLCGSA